LVEGLLEHCWPQEKENRISIPFPRMTYAEAMEQYGTDKPDTRFEMKVQISCRHCDVDKCLGSMCRKSLPVALLFKFDQLHEMESFLRSL
jgi:aspartyl-tRNA synthetase